MEKIGAKSKIRSFIGRVQSSTEEILSSTRHQDARSSRSSISSPSETAQLDLTSAIEYNYCLINSYLEERAQRQPSAYEAILANEHQESERSILASISKEFYLDPHLEVEVKNVEVDSSTLNNNNNNNTVCDNEDNNNNNNNYSQVQLEESLREEDEEIKVKLEEEKRDEDDKFSENVCLSILEQCVLSKLPALAPEGPTDFGDEFLHYLEVEKAKLEKQATVVSKRLTDLILDNERGFKDELARVREIERSLASAITVCANGRQCLHHSSRDFTEASLGIIHNHQRRSSIIAIISRLGEIQQLRSTMRHISHLFHYERDFSRAITLYHETSSRLEQMATDYVCVAEMRSRMVSMLEEAEEQMDQALSRMVDRFDSNAYATLVKAFRLIARVQPSVAQLQAHFTSAVHDSAFSIVLGYVQLFDNASASGTPVRRGLQSATNHMNDMTEQPPATASVDLKRKPLAELCTYLTPESILPCLTDLCRAFWYLMQNYFLALQFYRNLDRLEPEVNPGLEPEEVEYATSKLEQGVLRLWSDVQHKIRILVFSVEFVQREPEVVQDSNLINDSNFESNQQQDQLLFTFEEFIKILTVCEKMIEVGEEFCQIYHGNSTSGLELEVGGARAETTELQATLYRQTRAYFQSYHAVSMAELRIFLENEIWSRCPIETGSEFELIASLQEFAFLKTRLLRSRRTLSAPNYHSTPVKESGKMSNSSSASGSFLLSPMGKIRNRMFFRKGYFDPSDSGASCPFDEILNRIVTQATVDDDNDDTDKEEEELEAEVDETRKCLEIITTNTSLNVLRLMGRYMNIMFLLRPISHDIIRALLELFDYYFYTVYHYFATDPLPVPWLAQYQLPVHLPSSTIPTSPTPANLNSSLNSNSNATPLKNHFNAFIRRINETMIMNESNHHNDSNHHYHTHNSPKRASNSRYPCPTLPSYVQLDSSANLCALAERILAIESLIFIARQFYHLCPFLLEFLRNEVEEVGGSMVEDENTTTTKVTEEGFKLLQFYHDKMCLSVESLMQQCLHCVSTKLLPYESLLSQMSQVKWDLKDIPSIHSPYINVFICEIRKLDESCRKLLVEQDLAFLQPTNDPEVVMEPEVDDNLGRLAVMSRRVNESLWEAIVRTSNRLFVEGFAGAKKCSNEGRALMQLDYEQFLSHLEKVMSPYFAQGPDGSSLKAVKAVLSSEKALVEEYVKAFYLTETVLLEWVRQRPDCYSTKQIVALVNCIANDNRKLRAMLLAAIDTSSMDSSASTSTLMNTSGS